MLEIKLKLYSIDDVLELDGNTVLLDIIWYIENNDIYLDNGDISTLLPEISNQPTNTALAIDAMINKIREHDLLFDKTGRCWGNKLSNKDWSKA